MPFSKRKPFVLMMTLLALGSPAFANEGGGEGGKPAAPVNKEEKAFNEKTAKLNSLGNRIAEGEKRFAELVREKDAAKDSEEKQKIIAQMLEVTKQRNKDADEYNKVKMELKLRYPSQGEHLERRYQTQSKRTLEELEGVAGLDELLTRVKKVVEKKFASFEDEDKEEKVEKKRAKPAPAEEPKRLRLQK